MKSIFIIIGLMLIVPYWVTKALAVTGQDGVRSAADVDGFGVDFDAVPEGAATIF
jgi:hypothetical protein